MLVKYHLEIGIHTLKLLNFENCLKMSKVETGFVFYNASNLSAPDYNQNEPNPRIIDQINGKSEISTFRVI